MVGGACGLALPNQFLLLVHERVEAVTAGLADRIACELGFADLGHKATDGLR